MNRAPIASEETVTDVFQTTWYWQHPEKSRYYEAHLQRDLLNDLIILQAWGGLNSRRGSRKNTYCATDQMAQEYLTKLQKRRQQRGYILM